MRQELERLLDTHRAQRPEMQPQDYYKLLYQREFGCGHTAPAPETAGRHLMEEYARAAGLPGADAVLPPRDAQTPVSYTHLDVYKRQDEPPAAAHVRVNYIHRFFHLRQNLFHRGRHFFVFFVHQPQDLRSIRAVDLQRIGVALFGADRFDLYHWTCLLVARIAFCGLR